MHTSTPSRAAIREQLRSMRVSRGIRPSVLIDDLLAIGNAATHLPELGEEWFENLESVLEDLCDALARLED